MIETEFIGLFITTAIMLIGGLAVMIKPILKLNESIVTLNKNVEYLVSDNTRQDIQIIQNMKDIEVIDKVVTNHDVRISHLEKEKR